MIDRNRVPAVLLFLKAPHPGKVKTRLAKVVGDESACNIYCQLVQHQIASLPRDWPVEIHFSPASARAEFESWLGPAYLYFPQSDGDLGERLREATAAAFVREHRSLLLIGGDCPGLSAALLEAAAAALEGGAEVVIGPATDGGYYLLGLSQPSEFLFEDIPWSGPEVSRMTADRVRAAGLSLTWLDEMEDVDDLPAYRRALAAGYFTDSFPH